MRIATHEELLETMVAWASGVLGGLATVYQGNRGSVHTDPRVAVTVRSTVPDGPVETVYDEADAMRSQVSISTIEYAAEGAGYPGELTRRLAAAWSSEGGTGETLRSALALPVGSPGSVVDGQRSTGVASSVRRSVVTVRVRHQLGWREVDGAPAEVTEVSGTIEGDSDATGYSVRLVPVLAVEGAMLSVGPTALELTP